MADRGEFLKLIRNLVLEAFPWMRGHHAPVRARVVKVHEKGGRIGAFNRRYSVDVQPLLPDGSDDPEAPVIPDVEIPTLWAGPGRGVFALPVVGSIVRLGWYYHDPAHPYIDAILGDGFDCPDHPVGAFIVQHSDGTRIEITPERVIRVTTPVRVEIDAPEVVLAGGGPAVARVGDEVEVYVNGGSSAGTWQGRIVGGSERVTSG